MRDDEEGVEVESSTVERVEEIEEELVDVDELESEAEYASGEEEDEEEEAESSAVLLFHVGITRRSMTLSRARLPTYTAAVHPLPSSPSSSSCSAPSGLASAPHGWKFP